MKMIIPSLVLAFAILQPTPVAGAGSVEISDLEGVIKSNPAFDTFFTQQIELDNVGIATRLGRHYGDLSGTRVSPYEFPGRFVGGPKEDWPLRIVIHANWHIEDDGGQNFGQNPPPATAKNPRVVQVLERVEMISNQLPKKLPAEALTVESRVEEIRKIFTEVNAAQLTWNNPKVPFEAEISGELKRGSLNGKVRKVVLDYTPSDHGGATYEAYYDAAGQLAFVYSVSSYWQFTNGGESTVDHVTERRVYFENDTVVRALEKKYQFSGEGEGPAASRRAANQPITVGLPAARQYHQLFTQLVTAAPARVVGLAEEIQGADQGLTE